MEPQYSISAKNIYKAFGNKKVLDGVSFDLKKGESFVVMGGSGTGKSVLIKCIIGLLVPDEGSQVLIDGNDVTFLDIQERGHLIEKFGVLFQGGALFDSMPVWENVSFGMIQSKKLNKKQARELAEHKISLVGLTPDVCNLYPAELSGGMQKRVALARAIACDPEVIFFDEPTAGLDPIMAGVISDLILKCSKDLGATTITITHDMHCARTIANKAAMIHKGKFVWYGDGKDIDHSNNPFVEQFINGLANGPLTN